MPAPTSEAELSTRYGINEFDQIAKGLKELEAEKTARINGISLEDAKPVEAPADIDWTGMYGYPAGYKVTIEPTQIDILTHIDFINSLHD
jgi:hypothetical protein